MRAYFDRECEWMEDGLQLLLCPSFTGATGGMLPDISGKDANGVLTNMDRNTAWTTSGGKGALSFDGSTNHTAIASSRSLTPQNPSVSFWTYMRPQNSNIKGILDNNHAAFQGYVIQSEDATTNRRFYFAWHDGISFRGNAAVATVTIPLEKWSHICYSKNGATISGYLDGQQVYSVATANGNIFYTTPPRQVNIGGVLNEPSRRWNGNLDDIRIYNRALTATEIRQLYERDRGGGLLHEPPKRQAFFVPAMPLPVRRRSSRFIGFPG